jgi:hypothetical protein
MLKNIPVRQRKANIPHMENYCLFDPAVDFYNEKELLRRNNCATMQSLVDFQFPIGNFHNSHQQLQKRIVQKQHDVEQLKRQVYDISEHDERLLFHNYYEIDPDLLEDEEQQQLHNEEEVIDCNRIVESSSSTAAVIQTDKADNSKVYGVVATNHGNNKNNHNLMTSSSSSSSCDYPSLFNSVIETTPSSTIESTDENDTNGFMRMTNDDYDDGGDNMKRNNEFARNAINQTNGTHENVITCMNVVTTVTSATGARRKFSPQLDRIVNQKQMMKRNLPTSANQRNSSRALSLDPLKSSHSLPQLQDISLQITGGCDYKIEINKRATIQARKNARPLSTDSGFTTPSPPNEISLTTQAQCRNASSNNGESCSGSNNQVDNLDAAKVKNGKNESTVLNQCDNIQQLIEVSIITFYLINHCREMQ